MINTCKLNPCCGNFRDCNGGYDAAKPRSASGARREGQGAEVGPSIVAELLAQLKHAVHWHDQLTPADIARYEAVIAKAEGRS